jgi:hypothetical protein
VSERRRVQAGAGWHSPRFHDFLSSFDARREEQLRRGQIKPRPQRRPCERGRVSLCPGDFYWGGVYMFRDVWAARVEALGYDPRFLLPAPPPRLPAGFRVAPDHVPPLLPAPRIAGLLPAPRIAGLLPAPRPLTEAPPTEERAPRPRLALVPLPDDPRWVTARRQGEKLVALYEGRYDDRTDTITPRVGREAA